MAWRLHESVIRGELDNRTKGMVIGQLWLNGLEHPIELQFQGNACADLAGCLLQFRNPNPTLARDTRDQLRSLQQGTAGDMTASRKVRLPGPSSIEPGSNPDQMGNCLYLEWFSDANGRVLIEAVGWELTVSTPDWHLTPQDEQERSRQAAAGMTAFLERMTAVIEKHQHGQKDPEQEWNEHDYEKFFRECDARGEKYRELLEKYGDSPDADEKIDEAMGWNRPVENPFISEEEMQQVWDEAQNASEPDLDPAREGIDWIRTKNGDICHPLQHRCAESALRFWNAVEEFVSLETGPEELRQFIFEFQTTAAKLAGALNGLATDRQFVDAAFTVAYLKRALGHLHQSQAGLESLATHQLLPKDLIADARKEMFEIRQLILLRMDEFRGRL